MTKEAGEMSKEDFQKWLDKMKDNIRSEKKKITAGKIDTMHFDSMPPEVQKAVWEKAKITVKRPK